MGIQQRINSGLKIAGQINPHVCWSFVQGHICYKYMTHVTDLFIATKHLSSAQLQPGW